LTRARPGWPCWRAALTGLSALGLALSTFLGWHYLKGGPVFGCGGGSPCDEVLSGRWSTVGGVLPVSGLAAGVYLAMLVAGFFIGPATEAPVRRLAWGALLILVGAAAGSAMWFTFVQKWIIGAFCPYCMATHLTGLLLAALVVWQAPKQFHDAPNDVTPANPESASRAAALVRRGRVPRRWSRLRLAAGGLALAGMMAALQVGVAPAAVSPGGASRETPTALDPRTAPLIGSPDARYLVTLLFDYSCPHCQRLHFLLEEVVRRYGGQLAFALCPAPLNPQCNPYVPQSLEAFKDSCELAKIGLAVWVAKREAFPVFDGWMFSLESGDHWTPRSLDAARAKAIELVGPEKFAAAQADPSINRYLQTSVRIYGGTGDTAIPKLVFGSRWVIPQPDDADGLVAILQTSLFVPKP
jgi:uncharacterized membrane protein